MIEKSFSSTDQDSTTNCKNYHSYPSYIPCESYFQPPPPRSYQHYSTPCTCQSDRPSDFNSHEVHSTKETSWLPIILFALLIISIIIAYNFLRSHFSNSGRSTPSFLSHQNPHLLPIGAPLRKIEKRNVSENCPASNVCCTNNKGIIEPKYDQIPGTSTPRKLSLSSNSKHIVEKSRNSKNIAIDTASNKSRRSEETLLRENQKSSGTFMTDDEKLALRKVP